MITVLNSETARPVAVFRMLAAETGFLIPARLESSGDFLFLGTSKDNHLEVVRYVSR